jgi:hypothetical protein
MKSVTMEIFKMTMVAQTIVEPYQRSFVGIHQTAQQHQPNHAVKMI